MTAGKKEKALATTGKKHKKTGKQRTGKLTIQSYILKNTTFATLPLTYFLHLQNSWEE